ncbi:MAG: hypothetical protein ACYSUP_15350 [Planctomycetota bacterium]
MPKLLLERELRRLAVRTLGTWLHRVEELEGWEGPWAQGHAWRGDFRDIPRWQFV